MGTCTFTERHWFFMTSGIAGNTTLFNPLYCSSAKKGHVALDGNLGEGYNSLLLRMIPGDLLSACPHIHFHTLPGLLDTEAICTIFMMVFGMTSRDANPRPTA